MTLHIRLRRWQQDALDRFRCVRSPDFLAVATPGAGKTAFALVAVLGELTADPHRRVLVVAPTQHLKTQWARAAAEFGLHLDPGWSGREGGLAPDMHGVVVTYQQVAADPAGVAALARDAVIVLDEVHHAAEDRAWGDALRLAFLGAARRLSLSGTPFRSDTQAIPFLRYIADEAEADYSYGYAEALADGGVVRPVYFPRLDGEMEWTAPDGTHHAHTFADRLDATRAGQRLRTALSLEGEWLPAVIDRAHERLLAVRRTQPDAGGLVITMDTEHARGVAALLRRRLGVSATVATSEDAAASAKISAFASSSDPWIVAVRMVSEGVDIPRLRVGVYATNTTTELFFRQAVGRLVRWTRGVPAQQAFLFIPDDERLRTWATRLAEQRRHSLRRATPDDDEAVVRQERPAAPEEQLSLFAALAARPLDIPDAPEWLLDGEAPADPVDDADAKRLELTLVAPPPAGAGAASSSPLSRSDRKQQLRARNTDRARAISSLTNLGHAHVNRELNRLAGVRRIAEATVDQLEARLAHADGWLRRL